MDLLTYLIVVRLVSLSPFTMQFSNYEIKSALNQNAGDVEKALRFLNLYHEKLAGVQFPRDTPVDFQNTWEMYYNVPFTKEYLEPFLANDGETVLVQKLQRDLGLKSLDDFEKKVRSHYIQGFLSENLVYEKEYIGKGKYGEVYLATSTADNTVYVAKKMPSNQRRAYKRETKILSFVNKIDVRTRKSQNENVVGWFGSFVQDDSLVILTEFVEGDTLDRSKLRVWERWAHYPYIVHQLFSGLRFLHAKGIAHRDIKLQNVMLNPATAESKGKLVIIDLGLGCFLGDELPKELERFQCVESRLAGTDSYFSPQKASLLDLSERKKLENKMAEEKADLWAAALTMVCFITDIRSAIHALFMILDISELGVVLVMGGDEMLSHLAPYEDETKLEQIQNDVRKQLEKYYDEEIDRMILPEKRPQFKQNCEHIWEKLGQVFSGYKTMTSDDVLKLLNIRNSQDFFYESGEVQVGGRGLFTGEWQ